MRPDAGFTHEIGVVLGDLQTIRGEALAVRGVLDADLRNRGGTAVGEAEDVAWAKFLGGNESLPVDDVERMLAGPTIVSKSWAPLAARSEMANAC